MATVTHCVTLTLVVTNQRCMWKSCNVVASSDKTVDTLPSVYAHNRLAAAVVRRDSRPTRYSGHGASQHPVYLAIVPVHAGHIIIRALLPVLVAQNPVGKRATLVIIILL